MKICKNCGHTIEYLELIGIWSHTCNDEEYHKEYFHICSKECIGINGYATELCSNPTPKEYYSETAEKYDKFKRNHPTFWKRKFPKEWNKLHLEYAKYLLEREDLCKQ